MASRAHTTGDASARSTGDAGWQPNPGNRHQPGPGNSLARKTRCSGRVAGIRFTPGRHAVIGEGRVPVEDGSGGTGELRDKDQAQRAIRGRSAGAGRAKNRASACSPRSTFRPRCGRNWHCALAGDLTACAAGGAAPAAPDRRRSLPASDLPGGLAAADSPNAVSKLASLAAEPSGRAPALHASTWRRAECELALVEAEVLGWVVVDVRQGHVVGEERVPSRGIVHALAQRRIGFPL